MVVGMGAVVCRLWYANWNRKKVLQAVVPWPREKSQWWLLHLASAGPVVALWPEYHRQRWCPGRYGHRTGTMACWCQRARLSLLTTDGHRFLLSTNPPMFPLNPRTRFSSLLFYNCHTTQFQSLLLHPNCSLLKTSRPRLTRPTLELFRCNIEASRMAPPGANVTSYWENVTYLKSTYTIYAFASRRGLVSWLEL